jgi:hypothetical protein
MHSDKYIAWEVVTKLKETTNFADLNLDWTPILNLILKKSNGIVGPPFIWLTRGTTGVLL